MKFALIKKDFLPKRTVDSPFFFNTYKYAILGRNMQGMILNISNDLR